MSDTDQTLEFSTCAKSFVASTTTAKNKSWAVACVADPVAKGTVDLVGDSGCTQHIFNKSKESMQNVVMKQASIGGISDKTDLKALAVGDLPVYLKDDNDVEHLVTLKSVLWAPAATCSLLSISQAVRNGCTFGSDQEGIWLTIPVNGQTFILGEERNGLYIFNGRLRFPAPDIVSLSSSTTIDTGKAVSEQKVMDLAMQIHASLAHLNWTAVKELLKGGAFSQVAEMSAGEKASLLSVKTLLCPACDLSKKTMKTLPRTSPTPPKCNWERVEADHCGPFSPQLG